MEYNSKGEKKMGKKDKERRVYTKEFKAEAVALAEKREKPVSQVAKDLGLNALLSGLTFETHQKWL